MANTKKFAVKNGLTTPVVDFVSPSETSTLSATMLDSGILSVSGTAGQLFSITDSMTGSIFAVNDVSGIPSIEVFDTGKVQVAETVGNLLIGSSVDDGVNKVQITGKVKATDTLTITKAWNAADGSAGLYLNGTTGNRLEFGPTNGAPPSLTTRSAGTRIVLHPLVSGTQVDFGIGIDSYTMWNSVADTSCYFKWYHNTTNTMNLSWTGLGIGTAPSARLHSVFTGEQLRLGYDATKYTSFTTDSSGNLTIAPSGGTTNITGAFSSSGQSVIAGAYRFYTGGADGNSTYSDFRTNPASGNAILSAKSASLFLNWDHGSSGVFFGAGNSLSYAYMSATGQLTLNNNGILGAATIPSVRNTLDAAGGVVVGASYANVNTAPTNGLLVQGNVGIGIVSPSSALDVNGVLTVNGNRYAVKYNGYYATMTYLKLATLPIPDSGNFAQIRVSGTMGWWTALKQIVDISFSNRASFTYNSFIQGDTSSSVKIVAYTETDTTVSVYIGLYGFYIHDLQITGNGFTYGNLTSTTAPTGTLSFDSSVNSRMVISSAGDVAVGTTSTGHVYGLGGSLISSRATVAGIPTNNYPLLTLINANTYSAGTDKASNIAFGAIDSAGSYQVTSQILGVSNLTASQGGTGYIAFRTKTASNNVDATAAEVMRVTSGGNLGVGITDPAARIHSYSATEQLRLGYDATHYLKFTTDSSGNTVLGTAAAGSAVSLLSSGVLSVTSSGASASYAGGIKFTNTGYKHYTIGTKGYYFVVSDTSSGPLGWDTPTDRLTIGDTTFTYNGNTVYTTGNSTNLFNNTGNLYTLYTAFDATGAAPTYDFGWRFIGGSTNGPGTNSASQYYSEYVGLGSNYPGTGAGSYGMQIAYPRVGSGAPYISIRYNENGILGVWQKISAGLADTATTATNLSGGTVLTSAPTVYTAITSMAAANAPIRIPEVSVGSVAGFVPAIGQSTIYTSGYRQHMLIGNYRTANTYNGGMFIGLGGNDNNATEYFLLGYTGYINHSSGTLKFLGQTANDGPTISATDLLSTGTWTGAGVGTWTGDNSSGWTHVSGSLTALSHSVNVTGGVLYQIAITRSGSTTGTCTVTIGDASPISLPTAAGTYYHTPKAVGTTGLVVTPESGFLGTVKFTVKAITGASTALLSTLTSSGYIALESRTGPANLYNTFLGTNSGTYNTTGIQNVALGFGAQPYVTSGSYNVALGTNSQGSITTGNYNIGMGAATQYLLTNGTYNNAIGFYTQYSLTTGSYNIGIGPYTQYALTTGYKNISIGNSASRLLTTGTYNIAIGEGSQYSNSTTSNNTSIGTNSLYALTSGVQNVALGEGALYGMTSGSYNTAIGYAANYSGLIGNYNTSVGEGAEYNTTSGYNNTSLGMEAGRYIADGSTANTTHSNCVYVGSKARPLANSQDNQIVIGYDAVGNGANTATIGNSSITATYLKGAVSTTNSTGEQLRLNYDATKYASFTVDSSGNLLIAPSGGATSITGRFFVNKPVTSAFGYGSICLNNVDGTNVGNRIDFNTYGVAAPTTTTRSVGTKIVLYPNMDASNVDFAIGIEGSTLWTSVANSGHLFKWYHGTTNTMTLSNTALTAPSFVKSGGTSAQFLKADGSSDSNAYQPIYSMSRTLPTTVGNYVEIGSFELINGAHSFNIAITVSASGFSNSKVYDVTASYAGTGGAWQTVNPTVTTGPYVVQDFELEISQSVQIIYFRIRRTAGSIAATANINIQNLGFSTDAFVSTTGTGTSTASGTYQLNKFNSGLSITLDNATNASYYLGMSSTTSGSWTSAYVQSNLVFNPSTGVLSSTDFNSTSDRKLKKNIRSIESALPLIKRMDPVTFNWKDTDRPAAGLVAQDLEKILPDLVDSSTDAKKISYQQLIPYLIRAIQELQDQVDTLTNRVNNNGV